MGSNPAAPTNFLSSQPIDSQGIIGNTKRCEGRQIRLCYVGLLRSTVTAVSHAAAQRRIDVSKTRNLYKRGNMFYGRVAAPKTLRELRKASGHQKQNEVHRSLDMLSSIQN